MLKLVFQWPDLRISDLHFIVKYLYTCIMANLFINDTPFGTCESLACYIRDEEDTLIKRLDLG